MFFADTVQSFIGSLAYLAISIMHGFQFIGAYLQIRLETIHIFLVMAFAKPQRGAVHALT
jgi:hypothetical protein